jgi:hypothetical protein
VNVKGLIPEKGYKGTKYRKYLQYDLLTQQRPERF